MRNHTVPFFVVGVTILLSGETANGANNNKVLFTFKNNKDAKVWQTVNDGVMGGVSEGNFRMTTNGTMEFLGELSLKNNGGFASVRSKPTKLDLQEGETIIARIRGDGRKYYLNLFVPTLRIASSWRFPVQTKVDQWMEVRAPLKEFIATSFGRKINNAGTVDASKINSVGFLLSDKKEGPFKLEIDWIKVSKNTSSD